MNLPVMAPGLDRALVLEWSRRIEAGPFCHIAAGERINFPNPEILVTLSAAAAVTARVGILLNVLVLPMHSTPLAAKQLASLDVLSSGRLTVGVGAGARDDDYAAAGASRPAKPLTRLAEQVAELRRVWAGEIVVPGAERPIEPFPVQAGGPPVLAGSLSPASIRRAAAWADGICGFSFGPSIDEIDRSFELARAAWREADRERAPRLVTNCWFALGALPPLPRSGGREGARAHRDHRIAGRPRGGREARRRLRRGRAQPRSDHHGSGRGPARGGRDRRPRLLAITAHGM